MVFTGGQPELDLLRETYARDNYVILPRLYESTLFEEIVQRVDTARFFPRDHDGFALESCMADRATTAMLMFFPNNPVFLRLVEQITGQPRIGVFSGRVYRISSSEGHYYHWHDDFGEQRVASMTVNLSRRPFDGGALQLKHPGSDMIMHEVHNTGFGDALLFRLSRDLVHRVQGVKGEISKTAFAGWFFDVEDVLPNFRNNPGLPSHKYANDEPDWEVPVVPHHE